MRLFFLGLCFCLSLVHSLFSSSMDCRCGIVRYDPSYTKAVNALYESLPYQFRQGMSFPTDAHFYYPGEDYRGYYPCEGSISWYSSCFSGGGPPEQCIFYREIELFDHDATAKPEIRKFVLYRDYGAIIQAFHNLEQDLITYAESNIRFAEDRLNDIANGRDVSLRHSSLWSYSDESKQLSESKKTAEKSFKYDMERLESRKDEAFLACKASLDNCIATHQSVFAYVHKGLFSYLEGDVIEALDYIKSAMDQSPKGDLSELSDSALLMKGRAELEADLYADAIFSLTALIDRNPENKEAYFERATAYFELEDFDKSLLDYLQSDIRPVMPSDNSKILQESLAATEGLVRGIGIGTVDYLPNLAEGVSTLGRGLNHAVWAFGQHPLQASIDFASAVYQCAEFIVSQPVHTIGLLFPEAKELADDWQKLDKTERIQRTSTIIGKYGMTICLDVATASVFKKAVQATNKLLKANTLLNLEALRLNPVSMKTKTTQVNYTFCAERESVLQKRIPTQANSVRGWKVGQDIHNLTKEGKIPKWVTVKQRYWKNRAEWAKSNPSQTAYTNRDLDRMERGLAPQRVKDSGGLESKELHHNPPQRDGGLFDFEELWPDEHAQLDPSRYIKE